MLNLQANKNGQVKSVVVFMTDAIENISLM